MVDGAIEKGITSIILIGTHPDGEIYVSAQENDLDRVIGRISRALTWLSNFDIDHSYVVDTEENPDAVDPE